MADFELEDGELLDSDNDVPLQSNEQATAPPFAQTQPVQRHPNPNIYRDRRQTAMSSSDSEDESDEEKFLWKHKRLKYAAAKAHNGSRDTKFARIDPGTHLGSWSHTKKDVGFPSVDILKPKKKNIWGAVLQEQTLSQGFIGFDMEQKTEGYNDRSVEAYSFKRAQTDSRPWFNTEFEEEKTDTKNGDIFNEPPDLDKLEENFMGIRKQGRKRKRSVKERLGPRQYNKQKSRDHYKATASDPPDVVAEAVAENLNEPKLDLIIKVVHTMGRKKTLELAYLTDDIEDSGGMLTINGSRRRTPGGIFFQLLKTDPSFTKDKMKEIFGEEMKKEAKRKKKIRLKHLKSSLSKIKPVSTENENTMEMEDSSGVAKDESTNKSSGLKDDCNDDDDDDENSQEASHSSSDVSNCPDPKTMDLSELLKQHAESRRLQIEEEKKAIITTEGTGAKEQPMIDTPSETALEADICLDDESEMTFDL